MKTTKVQFFVYFNVTVPDTDNADDVARNKLLQALAQLPDDVQDTEVELV